MTIEQKAREIAERMAPAGDVWDADVERISLGIIEGLEMAAKAIQDDANLCDCSAWEESECACGAWCEWKTIPSHRAVEIIRALIEEQEV